MTLNIKQIISISTFNSSQPNTWTEQGSLQNAQAFGLLASYKDNLVHIGGRDPFSGVSLPLESKTGGDWGIWASLSGEITQYLSGCRRMNQERICKFRNTEKKCKVSVILFQSTLLLADYRGVKSLDLESFQLREIVSFPEGRVGSSIGCVFLELKPSSDLGVYYFSGGWIRLVFADK